MLCRKFKQILFNKSALNDKVQYYLLTSRLSRRCLLYDSLLTLSKGETMSTFRLTLKELRVMRLWSVWRRSFSISAVVKKCRKDVGVKEMILAFKHAFLRPRRTILMSAAAAYKNHCDDCEPPLSCEKSITDEELEALLTELDGVEKLSKTTLFCTCCGKRLVVDKKLPGIRYCACKDISRCEESSEGWEPYMETEDVIIWRKEYKPGQGLYAYKVYGRYKEVCAQDFAAVQVDGGYRRAWDTAVAALSVVERRANGLRDQAVLHWEVLWPRLFANRDYVYIRRHKEFEVKCSKRHAHTEILFDTPPHPPPAHVDTQRPNVHSKAKRKAMEHFEREKESNSTNKVYVILSRSCKHTDVPETKHAIRVSEYWSHMFVKTLNGVDKPGMEFVLTYYDEPAVGGLPAGVAAWATGRAAPAYLQRMRAAAARYRQWGAREDQDLPDYSTFPHEKMSHEHNINEEDMESSQQGPELENGEEPTRDQGTQTENGPDEGPAAAVLQREVKMAKCIPSRARSNAGDSMNEPPTQEGDNDKSEEDNKTNSSWWRVIPKRDVTEVGIPEPESEPEVRNNPNSG
ncbi:LOW QUALITY PROTEIN: uncharacterized protein ACR2FA_008374 [Aphomia sociella]